MIHFRLVRMEEVKFGLWNYPDSYLGNEILVKDEASFITWQQFVPETSFPRKGQLGSKAAFLGKYKAVPNIYDFFGTAAPISQNGI